MGLHLSEANSFVSKEAIVYYICRIPARLCRHKYWRKLSEDASDYQQENYSTPLAAFDRGESCQ